MASESKETLDKEVARLGKFSTSFTDLVTATGWNIGFLAVVSVWRVFLVTRSLN